jgi:hypothetical protein
MGAKPCEVREIRGLSALVTVFATRWVLWIGICAVSLFVSPVLAAERVTVRKQTHVVSACFDFLPADQREDPTLACELSALIHHEGRLWFFNDKSHASLPVSLTASLLPKASHQSKHASDDVGKARDTETYLTALRAGPNSPLDHASKFEAAAQSVDDPIDFAITAFDRFDSLNPRFDRFNALFFWPRGQIERARLVARSERNGQLSSIKLRALLESQVKSSYFKIEGLAALPGRRLLVGIRETGSSFREPVFRFLVTELRYVLDSEHGLRLLDDVRIVADWQPSELFAPEVPQAPPAVSQVSPAVSQVSPAVSQASREDRQAVIPGLGLSSIEYCQDHDRLFFLLSAESNSRMDGFLLSQKREQFEAGEKPSFLRDEQGHLVRFSHKPEGMAVIGSDCRLLISHDDDRFLGGTPSRDNLREMIYSVIDLRLN